MSGVYGTDSATATSGTFVLPNDTAEHDIIEVVNTTGRIQDFSVFVDITAITKNNFKLMLYVKIDGANYRLHNTYTYSASETVAQFDELRTSFSIKVTAQSATAEGATRNLPYQYTVDPR